MAMPDQRPLGHSTAVCQYAAAESAATDAAKQAVREVFYLLGVDVDNPKQVEEFRKSLRFSDELRKLSERGKIIFVAAFTTFIAGALWIGFKSKIVG